MKLKLKWNSKNTYTTKNKLEIKKYNTCGWFPLFDFDKIFLLEHYYINLCVGIYLISLV